MRAASIFRTSSLILSQYTLYLFASLRSCKRARSRRRSGGFTPSLAMTITVSPEDPRSPEAQKLLNAFVQEVRHRYESAPADVGDFDPALVSAPKSAFLVARVEGEAVGCCALVPMGDDVVEIKRMFVLPAQRRPGIAKKILDPPPSPSHHSDYHPY